MSDCCTDKTTPDTFPGKYRCPVNGREYRAVGAKTLLHHIKSPWQFALKEQGYYFCSDPQCQVVYFGQDNSVIRLADLETRVGQKETQCDRPVCYCFNVTQQAAEQDASIKDFVKQKTRAALCSCETSNPSGKCCLKDFPC